MPRGTKLPKGDISRAFASSTTKEIMDALSLKPLEETSLINLCDKLNKSVGAVQLAANTLIRYGFMTRRKAMTTTMYRLTDRGIKACDVYKQRTTK